MALTIAGSDSGGGAGVEADLKTFWAHGVWGTAAVTAVTAQNSLGIQASDALSPEIVRAQIASVVADFGVDAAKTGMLGSAGTVESVARTVGQLGVSPLVVDPVMVSSQGDLLLDPDALDVLTDQLLPLATVVTPNLAEAAVLVGGTLALRGISSRVDMETAARAILEFGPEAVLVTGGHLDGEASPDCLVLADDNEAIWMEGARLPGRAAHGTGCVLSAAICAGLALGLGTEDACRQAKTFVARAIASAVQLGEGPPATNPGGGS